MTTTAAEPVFIDSNLLVYAQQVFSPFHAAAVARIDGLLDAGHPIWISRQVLREYLSSMSRPGSSTPLVPISDLIVDVERFESCFHVAEEAKAVTARLLDLLAMIPCRGKQVHDANIVATMNVYGIGNLATHNVGDFKRFSGIITILPLIT